MNMEIKIFKNSQFAEIRVMMKDGEPWFCAVDVCDALGYGNSREALRKHIEEDDVTKRDTIDEALFQGVNKEDSGHPQRSQLVLDI